MQTAEENCVAHNGSLIPIPGRDVMVQAWYQGGVSVFDWTDPKNPVEIAFCDRGPVNGERMEMGGSWSAYWYDGADQLERAGALEAGRIEGTRRGLTESENASAADRRHTLEMMAGHLERGAGTSEDPDRIRALVSTMRELAG